MFNPQSLAGSAPHAKVRLCWSVAHGQAFKVKPDLTQHLLPAGAPLCIRWKAGLFIVAFKAPGCLALAAYDFVLAGGIAPMPSSFFLHPPQPQGPPLQLFRAFSSLALGTSVGYILPSFLCRTSRDLWNPTDGTPCSGPCSALLKLFCLPEAFLIVQVTACVSESRPSGIQD